MTTMDEIRHRDRKRVSILHNVKLAGPAGLVLDEDYVSPAELASIVRAGLLVALPGTNRHQLTKKAANLLRQKGR